MRSLRNQLQKRAGDLLRNRRFVRAPILIYRARLGAIFGKRLLMLEHRGRKTGARRYVVLEVIDHPAPNEYVVASGFGSRAQWFRNLQHDPHARVTIGSHRPATATAMQLDRQQTSQVLQRYARQHPRSWQQLKPIFEDVLGSAIDIDNTDLPLILLTLESKPARSG